MKGLGGVGVGELMLRHKAEIANIQDTQGRAPVHWATMLPDLS